jgi:predicted ester cyclase
MKGFDAEFRDLDHYIRVITDRIWEGRRIDDIRLYYGEGCAVETPSAVSIGVDPVVDGTRATLMAFPDRRLLAEDVIISGDEDLGFLSSHRIFSPMTHAGPGVFGPPTGRAVYARTVADCVCVNNRVVHEWLVRDQAAIARQIGRHEREVAQDWLDQRGRFHKPAMPPAPGGYVSFVDTQDAAAAYADGLRQIWTTQDTAGLARTHDSSAIAALPGGQAAAGLPAIHTFWRGMTEALACDSFSLEHLVANPRAGRATAIASRWRVQARHTGAGRYGAATGRPLEVMGISHAEVEGGRVVREWHLIDDVAVWMQVLEPRG